MRRFTGFTFAVTVLALAGSARGVDLTTINRTIAKLPELRSKSPGYCLLVFGPEAAKHVWLVHDDDVLYVDRNGNGDLTEADERVVADAKFSKPEERLYIFYVRDIPDEPASHKELYVRYSKLTTLRTSDEARAILASSETVRVCVLHVDVAIADLRGEGFEGRVPHWVPSVKFAAKPESAPIIHFGGPLEITLNGNQALRAGRLNEVQLFYGTRGLGPGTFAAAAYQNVIPITASPVARLTLPKSSSDSSEHELSFDLVKRCCTYSLYGDVRLPDDAPTGKAKLQLSLNALPSVYVAPTEHEVIILPRRPGPPDLPVSSRLAGRLEHANPNASTWQIHYAPDGKRLVADDYPQGLVHVWDLASGRPTTTIEVGHGSRTLNTYFSVAPDWKTAIGAARDRGVFDKVEVDGKRLNRVKHDGQILQWDLETGAVLRTLQHEPRRGIVRLAVSPDGKFALAQEELPGTFERYRNHATTLWDLSTGQPRDVGQGYTWSGIFSPDSKSFAIVVPKSNETVTTKAVKILSVPDCKEIRSISFDDERMRADIAGISSDGRLLFGAKDRHASPSDFKNFDSSLVLWSCETGEETLVFPFHEDEYGTSILQSPDARTVAATSWSVAAQRGHLILVDLAERTTRIIDLAPRAFSHTMSFHPSGRWLAVATQQFPDRDGRNQIPPEEMFQPKIECVDLASGQIVETIVMPQCHLLSMDFSPDGSKLATSGLGSVLLWDVRTPPGTTAAAPDAQ